MRKQTPHDETTEIPHTLGLDLIYSTLKDKKNSFFKKAVFERDLRITELLLNTIPKTCGSDSIVNDFVHFLKENHEEIDESVLDIVQMLLNAISIESESEVSLEETVEIGDLRLIELLCQYIPHEYFLNSPMISAIKKGRCDIIEMLIKYGANLSDTMLMRVAIQYGQIDCAKFLHKRGASINVTSAISVAVNSKQANSLLLLAELFKEETRKTLQESGTHILFEAVENGYEEMIRILIDIGADVNAIFKGKTILLAAKDSHVIELLVKLGADVNKVVDIHGESDTALSHLLKECLCKTRDVNGNRLEIVNTIIKNSVDLNSTDSFGDTHLMLSVRIPNFSEVVRLLLHSGADVSRQNKKGKTALHFAVEYGSVVVANLLLEYKTDVNVKCVQGKTPLLIAVEKDFLECAKVLLEYKADVNIKNVNYQRPLMIAVSSLNIAMVKLLIDNDATIDDKDNKGETALFRVAAHHEVDAGEIVKILAEAGACLDHQNREGKTTLMLAAEHKNVNVITSLCKSGADINVVNTIRKETALSILTNKASYYCDFDIIRTLINNCANISYVSASFVNVCIIEEEWGILRTVISLGLGPYDPDLEKVKEDYLMEYSEYGASPLETALNKGHATLAKYFNDIWFLTESDITALFSGVDVYEMVLISGDQSCLEFFESYLTQPMSLQKLSFVVVSSAIGAEQGREERVKKLKLPAFLQNKLLFKHALETEIEPTVDKNIRDKNTNAGLGHLFKDFMTMFGSEIGLNEYLPYVDDQDDDYSD